MADKFSICGVTAKICVTPDEIGIGQHGSLDLNCENVSLVPAMVVLNSHRSSDLNVATVAGGQTAVHLPARPNVWLGNRSQPVSTNAGTVLGISTGPATIEALVHVQDALGTLIQGNRLGTDVQVN